MRRALIAFLALLSLTAASGSAAQEPARIALLIGNKGYSAKVGPLRNPHVDVDVVAAALRSIGFEVLPPVREARRAQMLAAVRQLAGRLRTAGPGAVGFLYYSGHGAAEADSRTNYLLPIDTPEPGSATFWDEALKLDDILRLLDAAREAAKFVVFDACRNELASTDRSTTKGFVQIPRQEGLFIAYATAEGRTASDGGSGGGPYAAALAREIVKPGVHHLDLFQNVKEAVIEATGGVQQPWESNGLRRRVVLAGAAAVPPQRDAAAPTQAGRQQRDLDPAAQAWEKITWGGRVPSNAELELVVRHYGSSFHGGLARIELDKRRAAASEIAGRPAASAPPAGTNPFADPFLSRPAPVAPAPPKPERKNVYAVSCVENVVREPGIAKGFRVSARLVRDGLSSEIELTGPGGERVQMTAAGIEATMPDGTFVRTDGSQTPIEAGLMDGTLSMKFVREPDLARLRDYPASQLGELAGLKRVAELAMRFAGCQR